MSQPWEATIAVTPMATTEARIAESLGLSEEDVLTTTEVEMVREFLTDLSTRWDEILNQMRNNLWRGILDRILIEKTDYHFNVHVIWRSGFEQEGSMSYRLFRDVGSSRGSSLRQYHAPRSRRATMWM
jgi:hypothetical protein